MTKEIKIKEGLPKKEHKYATYTKNLLINHRIEGLTFQTAEGLRQYIYRVGGAPVVMKQKDGLYSVGLRSIRNEDLWYRHRHYR
jgi:hypothetical protein